MCPRPQPEDELEAFGYLCDENDEISSKNEYFRVSNVGSFLQRWWTESLWPGMGLFGESYLLFSIGTLTPLWKELYPACWSYKREDPNSSEGKDYIYYSAYEIYASRNAVYSDTCSPRLLESLTYGVVLGVILGMVLLGYWSNHIGRRKGSILTASLMACGSFGLVALSVLGALFWSAQNIFRGTVACLVVFGIGVGGEYPLSASLASEKATEELIKKQKLLAELEQNSSDRKASGLDQSPSPMIISKGQPSNRGRRVQLVFAMQGMGIWFNSLTMLVLLWALTKQSVDGNRENHDDDTNNGDIEYDTKALLIVWRVTYGIGALVLGFVLLTRIWYLEESKVWLEANKPNSNQVNDEQRKLEPMYDNTPKTKHDKFKLVHQQYGSRMFGAGMAWLLWDISFYGNKLFQSTFLLALVGDNASLTELTGAAALNATVALLGYYGAAVLIDIPSGGRKSLQSIGLLTTGVLFFACGWLASSVSPGITVILYLMSSFVGQLGPNCTTFLIPAEIVPTHQRTYCHGICAASGKIGALIAAVIFHFIGSENDGASLFYLCGFAGILGAAVTQIFVPETAGLDLLELDLQWKILLDGRRNYDGPAVREDHLSVYERYRFRKKKGKSSTNESDSIPKQRYLP